MKEKTDSSFNQETLQMSARVARCSLAYQASPVCVLLQFNLRKLLIDHPPVLTTAGVMCRSYWRSSGVGTL